MDSICSTLKLWIDSTKKRSIAFQWRLDSIQKQIDNLNCENNKSLEQLKECDRKHRELTKFITLYNNELWITQKEERVYITLNNLFKCPKE